MSPGVFSKWVVVLLHVQPEESWLIPQSWDLFGVSACETSMGQMGSRTSQSQPSPQLAGALKAFTPWTLHFPRMGEEREWLGRFSVVEASLSVRNTHHCASLALTGLSQMRL